MKKILVPISGTVTAIESAEYAMRVAKAVQAEIHVLHVVNGDDEVDTMTDSLKVFVLASKNFRVFVQGFTVVGMVVDQIINHAEENDISLILMGASDGAVVEKWISHEVLGHTTIPVLVIPYQIFEFDVEADEMD